MEQNLSVAPPRDLEDVAYSVVQTSDGGYALAGYTGGYVIGGYDVYLVKTYANGTMEWNQTYGEMGIDDYDDYGHSVIQTSDGGYAVVGSTESYRDPPGNDFDTYLIKTFADGTMKWNQTYGFMDSNECGYCVIQTSDGGYAVAGTSSYDGAENDYCFKTSADGEFEWYPHLYLWAAYSVIQTNDGGYAWAGYDNSSSVAHASLEKTNADGDQEWQYVSEQGARGDVAYSVVQADDGGYAITGYTYSPTLPDSYDDVLLAKIDGSGRMALEQGVTIANITADTLTFYRGPFDWYYNYIRVRLWVIKDGYEYMPGWNQTYGGTNYDQGYSLVQTSEGGYAIAGSTNSFGSGYQAYLVKTLADGTIEWNQTYGGTSGDYGCSVVQTSDGGYAIAGDTKSHGSATQAYLVKTFADGTTQWQRTYGGAQYDDAYSLVQTVDGGYALAGRTYSYGPGTPDYANVYLVKTDTSGLLDWNL